MLTKVPVEQFIKNVIKRSLTRARSKISSFQKQNQSNESFYLWFCNGISEEYIYISLTEAGMVMGTVCGVNVDINIDIHNVEVINEIADRMMEKIRGEIKTW